MAPAFPFSAIAGQDEMKLAMTIAAVDGSIGGVLVFGDRGTGKSTVVRALAGLLPTIRAAADCPYNCDPDKEDALCDSCRDKTAAGKSLKVRRIDVPVVDLPLGVTEDRVVGALDLERALSSGEKAFEPGLLARANRGFLYIDEVNLLEDHIVDLLLDVAASGENVVEREGLSVRHPAKFVLIGSGNPEEGELRPQLLDRFGLSVEVSTPEDLHTRMQVVRRRDEYEADPHAFVEKWKRKDGQVRRNIERARDQLPEVEVSDNILEHTSRLCIALGTDGLRGELTLIRAARAAAALELADKVETKHLRQVAPVALRHRLRRNPLDESGSTTRVQRAIEEHLPE
ncbi:magnesium chelatase ATPase subunit I [Halorhodospira halochloris]|uniref:magnesium chelatase ATPase subunit I n=1 Tax=Halorhodospira halochloris TaxID=1052 RepID=UPI001EE94B02|nr:magnesium chelatase ATPase subunit I [Halorhodospira halochloris]MCG5548075.1 magnesium chelatase ATPase subunit I [Halorhodospira halochloris]